MIEVTSANFEEQVPRERAGARRLLGALVRPVPGDHADA
jgi:hypothetical protein